jgi:hypothetical protein
MGRERASENEMVLGLLAALEGVMTYVGENKGREGDTQHTHSHTRSQIDAALVITRTRMLCFMSHGLHPLSCACRFAQRDVADVWTHTPRSGVTKEEVACM